MFSAASLRRILSGTFLAGFVAGALCAQDIAGDWQGTLKAGTQQLRIILQIGKDAHGSWDAKMYSIDQGPEAIPVNSVQLDAANLKFTVDAVGGKYEGKVSPDGQSIAGTWTQGQPLRLEFRRTTKATAWEHDASPHHAQFVTVDGNVKLEVLDWGGTGRPVVLLAGLGNTAHVFDKFAPKLTSTYHVYGITRRGFGESSAPAPDGTNYSADRLGDDVLAVCDSLKLNRPILVGHSIAGEELSSIGSRHPEKVAGLIYLDAGYPYAYYDRARGDFLIDSAVLEKKLQQMRPGSGPEDQRALVKEILQTDLPQLEKDLQERQKELDAMPAPQSGKSAGPPMPAVPAAILAGEEKYTEIRVPILAIFALPHDTGPDTKNDPKARAAAEAHDLKFTGAQAQAFENGVPSAHVVRLAHANHFVFLSNEADVLREVNAFIRGLH
ncbi:MAG TPA: alpha/beta hydrolase [Bryobacteraceae bacterium]|jgi:pimeloyl-ACP methyl ester carboxylesterase|nr:alpha/beta hydrolase [Bryobacteraceae bacterium]